MIVSEDNGPELGCYGDPYSRTPHLDQLAANGVRFNRAFIAQAGCSQSRASILTGLYPHQHGQIGLATWGFRMYKPDTPNLVRSLKEAGYRTRIIGKLHINPAAAFPFDMHEILTSNFSRKNLSDYAGYAEAFVNADNHPFLLSVNYPDAHAPWIKKIEGLPRRLNADYYNCLSRLDSLIGDLLEALQHSGKSDNTLVVYIGDHGADFLRGKRTSYENGVRIPLIIRRPGRELVLSQFFRPFKPSLPKVMGYSIRTDTHRYTRWIQWPRRKLMAEELYDYTSPAGVVRMSAFLVERQNLVQDPAYAETRDRLRLRMDRVLRERLTETVTPSEPGGVAKPENKKTRNRR
ncbi:MAG: sulfatase-like hydrolase/transferase [Planctomycetota bacterium]|jgi:arylsulfatase A-like enzyme